MKYVFNTMTRGINESINSIVSPNLATDFIKEGAFKLMYYACQYPREWEREDCLFPSP